MSDQKLYEDAVHRLLQYNYEVIADGQGYLVRHTVNADDISQARNLADLIDLAELIEWDYQRSNSAQM